MNFIFEFLKKFPKSFSTILGATILLTSLSLLSKGVGFFREIIIANNFGISDKYDIFLVSSTIPLILNTTALYLGQNYFIPAYSSLINESKESKKNFFTSTFLFFSLIGIILTTILYLISPLLMKFYINKTDPESISLAVKLLRIYLFTVPSSFGLAIISAYHQVKYNYKIPGYIQLGANVIILLIIILFSELLAVYVIPFAFLAGVTIQFVVLIFSVRRDLSFRLNYGLIKNHWSTNFLIISLIEIITISFVFVDRYFYGAVNPGGIASLNYAQTIYLLPISIIVLSFSTVLLPKFSNSFAEGDFELLQKRFSYAIYFIMLVFIPLTLLLAAHSEIIIKLVFQRGEFTNDATRQTSSLLSILSLSFIFYAVYGILNKLMLSMKLTKQLLIIVVVSLFAKFIFNKLLVPIYFEEALALTTVAVFVIISIAAAIIISFRSKIKMPLKYMLKFLFAFGFSATASLALAHLVNLILYEQILRSIIQILLFIIFYSLFAFTVIPVTIRKQVSSFIAFNNK